ncbi:hypothetical protein Tco_0555825 [Tanacetum coccineum]
MIDQDKIMMAAGGNIMRKTPQEAYDLIENMTQHQFQRDAKMYYDTTTGVIAHYSDTTYASIAPVEVLEKQTAYTIQSFRHQPRPEYKIFCFDMEEKSSGSTTTHSDYSLPDYDAFYFDGDHIEDKSSGSTTTHSDFSLTEYDSFIFDLSIDPFPPADRSDSHHEEFADELAHIISSPEYDSFYFDIEPDLGELTILFEENISKDSTKELTISFPSRNEDIIFDPGIFIIKGVQSERFHILPLDDFYSISFVSAPLFLTDPPEIETFLQFAE